MPMSYCVFPPSSTHTPPCLALYFGHVPFLSREPGRRRPFLARVSADRRSETRERELAPRA